MTYFTHHVLGGRLTMIWHSAVSIGEKMKKICDGCRVMKPHEHRCHDWTMCGCKECGIIERTTPGINVANTLDRLRHEVNRAQKNAIIDDAIEQLRRDQHSFDDSIEALKALVSMLEEWDSRFTKEGEEFDAVLNARAVIKKVGAK